eukprot:TRINITY_DN9023_c0_g1_i2.p1 TRINITY_DN9023_c0_g1~~TRINITY_DN9023_c0_g1_i2.p1  ORF type:complete len:631 (-),score=84.56 TRINITY_DN9023_c0_g1_i2:30-1922(-)
MMDDASLFELFGLTYIGSMAVFVVVQAIIIYRELARLSVTGLGSAVKTVLSNIVGIVRLQRKVDDPLERHIHAIVQERVADRIRRAATMSSHLAIVGVVLRAGMFSSQMPRINDSLSICVAQYLKLPEVIWLVILTPISQVWTACPLWVGPRTSYVIWVVHCAFDCGSPFLFVSFDHLVSGRLVRVAYRFMFAAVLGNPPIATIVNSLISLCSIFAYTTLVCQSNFDCAASRTWDIASCEGNSGISEFAQNEIITSVFVILLAWLLEHLARNEARATFEASMSAQAKVKTEQLLSAMSDAVLRLDSHFRIQNGSTQLAGLLFRRNGRNEIGGCSFIDLVAEEDRDRVICCLSPAPAQDVVTVDADGNPVEDQQSTAHEAEIHVAPTLHLSLLDGHNGPVPVQMFFVQFQNLVDECCYLLGIRGLLDVERLPPAPLDGSVHTSPTPIHTVFHESVPSVDSDVPSLLSGDLESMLEVQNCLWFSAVTFLILRASPSFSALCGPSSVEVPFIDWVPADQKNHFKELVQTTVNNFYNEEGSCHTSGEIRFHPPGLRSRALYGATFTLDMDDVSVLKCENEDDALVIRMTLHDVKLHRGSKSSKSSFHHEMMQAKSERLERQRRVTTNGRSKIAL